jgi:hypothetical protein
MQTINSNNSNNQNILINLSRKEKLEYLKSYFNCSKMKIYRAFKPEDKNVSETLREKILEIASIIKYDSTNYRQIDPIHKDIIHLEEIYQTLCLNSKIIHDSKKSFRYDYIKKSLLVYLDLKNYQLSDKEIIEYVYKDLYKFDIQSSIIFLQNEGYEINEIKEVLKYE